ncbi:hypothetical protein RUND412_009195 [Rhizina undulata]
MVKLHLARQGSSKYNRLVKFNVRIILILLSMDCLIIGTMSVENSFVYMQFHPLAYNVKLKIELAMADLIRQIATEKHSLNNFELTGTQDSQTSNGGIVFRKELDVDSCSTEDQSNS